MHTKQLSQWHPKVIPTGVTGDLSAQTLNPKPRITSFSCHHIQFDNLGPRKTHCTPSLVHYTIQCNLLDIAHVATKVHVTLRRFARLKSRCVIILDLM